MYDFLLARFVFAEVKWSIPFINETTKNIQKHAWNT